MSRDELPTPVIKAAQDSLRWLKASKTPHVAIGGLAVSLLGRPRFTRDVDFMVWPDESNLPPWIDSGKAFGIERRLPDADTFALQSRLVLMTHTPTGVEIDLALTGSTFEQELLEHSKRQRIGKMSIPVPAPEYLVVIKSVAARPHDMGDVDSILDVHPNVDLQWVRNWLVQFVEILESDEIIRKFDQYVSDRKQRLGLK